MRELEFNAVQMAIGLFWCLYEIIPAKEDRGRLKAAEENS